MGIREQLLKNRRIFVRLALPLMLAPLVTSCSKVGFQVTEGSSQQIEALCGISDLPSPTGPKITAPPPDQYVHPDVTLEGTCDGNTPVKIEGAGIAAPITTACVNGKFKQAIILVNGDGLKALSVSQDQIAGISKRCLMLDTTPPVVLISTPSNIYVNNQTVSVIGNCETGIAVQVTQGTAPAMATTCDGGKFSARFPTTIGDGPKTVVATQTDLAGNVGHDDQQYIIDTAPPVVKILTPLANAIIKNSVPVTGTCETGLPVNLSGTAVGTPVTTACLSGQFSATIIVSNVDGVFFITAVQIDLAGNRGWDQRNVVRDTTAPVITINTPAAGTVATTGVPLTGSCTNGLPVVISGTGVSANQTVQCGAGSFSAVVTFSAGDGTKNVVATQTDTAGNVGSDNRNFIKDSTGPAIKITGPAVGTITRLTIALTGTCESGLSVSLTGNIVPAATSCTNGQFNFTVTLAGADGTKNVVASQTDAIGNVGSDNRNFVMDTIAPAIKITSPAAGTTSQTGVAVLGTCTSGLNIEVSGGISSPSSAVCLNGAFSFNAVFSAGDGTKNIMVAQTDAAGNRGSDNRDFIKDTTAPAIAITAPAAGTIAQTGVTLVGTCTSGLLVNISGAGVSASSTTTCASGQFSTPITFSAGDGTKNVIAAQTDTAGNSGSDNRNFQRDATAPALQITGPAVNTSTRGPLTVTGVCADGLPVNLSGAIAAPVTVTCAAGLFSANVTLSAPDGVKNVVATQTDSAGNMGTDNRNFILDTIAPVITITSPPAGTVSQTGVTLAGTCTAGITVNISGDVSTPSTTTCPAGQFSAPVTFSAGDGNKNIVATQTDAAGNMGSDHRNFIKDTAAPAIAITAPAAGTAAQTGLTISGTCTAGLIVNISGAGVSSATTTTCPAGTFSTPITFSAGDGTKNVVASQTDAAGNTGSDNRSFLRNNVGPSIQIAAPAAGTVTRSTIALSGTCTNGFAVNISGEITAPVNTTCNAGLFAATITLSAPDGTKNVVASQSDGIGNTGSDSRNFILQTAIPVIRIVAPAVNTMTRSGLTVTGTCTTGLVIQVTGNITPGTATCTGGQFSTNVTFTAPDGTKNVNVSQTDSVGNSGSDNRNFILDTIAPVVKFLTPPAGTVAQNGLTVTGSCETGLVVQLTGAGLSAAGTAPCAAGQFTANIIFSGGDGTKNVIASQTDGAGNVGTDNRDFTRNNIGPAIKITAPPSGTATRSTIALVGTCTNGFAVNISGGIAAPMSATCNAGAWNATVTLSAPDGTKNVVASQTDAIGNVGSDNRNFVLQTAAPVITIVSPAANTITRSGLTITGTCASGLVIQVTGDISPGTASCTNGVYSTNVTFSAPDGTKNVMVSQTDSVGNTGSANRNFILDATAPVVKFVIPPAGTVAQNGLTVTGTCETGLAVQLSGTGLSAPSSTACAGGQFSAAINFSGGDGTKNIVATQTDAAGNVGSDNRDFLRNNIGPAIKITAPPAGTATRSTIALVGTCTNGFAVNISGGITAPMSTTCNAGAWNATVTLSAPDGTKNVVASQTDTIGNVGSDNRNFILQTAAPVITIVTPPANTVTRSGLTITGTCATGLGIQVTGDITPGTAACANGVYSTNVTFSAPDGTKNVMVSQTDPVGNSGSANRNFILDATAPVVKFVSPPAGTIAQNGLTVTGTCETGLSVQLSGTGLSAPSSTACAGGQFSAAINFSSGDGTKNIVATQTDLAGNAGSDNRDFLRNNVGPAIKITAPPAGTITRSTIALVGTCTNGFGVNISSGITAPMSTTCNAGAWNATVTLSAPDGTKNVVASQTDGIGNVGSDNRNFVLQTAAPTITIATPAANTTTRSGLTITGTCTNGLVIQVTGDLTPGTATCANGVYSTNVSFLAPDGTKNVMVSQTDSVGNTGSANRNFILDSTGPIVKFVTPPAGTIAQTGLTVTGTCETGLVVQLSGTGLNAPGQTACTAGAFTANILFSAGDGTKNIVATQADAAGNIGTDNRSFLRNNVGPAIKITAPPAGTITRSTIALVGTCTDGFAVNIAGAITAPMSTACNSGAWNATVTLSAPDGTKNVVASQTDGIGNVGSDNRNFILQTAAPAITIATPAANTITRSGLTITGTCTNGLVIQVTDDLTPGTATCANGVYSTNVTFLAPDGTKNVVVAQTDSVGNTGSANRNFILDATAPIVRFVTPTAGTVAQNGLTITGTCESGLAVQLSGSGLAVPGPITCPAGQFSANITFSAGDGTKNIVATQTDAAGNVGSDNRDFIKDATAPLITITSPAAGFVTRSTIALVGTCTDGLTINLSGAISPSLAVCAGGQWNAVVTLLPPDGTKNVVASQTDAAGNTGSANRDFVLKTTAPTIKITGPAVNSVSRSGITLVGTCTTGLTITLSGAAAGTTACPNGAFSTNVTFTAPDGTKNVAVSQTDAAGNNGADNRDFILDTTAPIVRFTSPPAGTVGQNGLTVAGTCEAGLQVQLSGSGIGVAGSVTCPAGQFNATITFSAGDGTKNIVATQTDTAGNFGSDNRDFVRDGTGPAIKIVTPLANAVTNSGFTLTGTCETGLTITVGGTGLSGTKTTNCTASVFSTPITLASPDGTKNVTVSQTDAAGNVGSDNRNFILDSTAPNVTITAPANGANVIGPFTLLGACEAGLALNITGDLLAPSTTTCPASGNYSVALTVTAGNGAKIVRASQTDLAGNVGTAQATYTVTPKPSATETFLADQGEGKVDILFVDDNSASMDPEQAALGQKFPSFVQELTGLDWQAGITTTDCSTGKWGICGSLLNMTGTTSNFLTPLVAGYDQVFNNTIQRPETLNCAARGECPSGLEEGLKASMGAIDKRATANAGFFRDTAALAIVILTDEDEQSNGPVTATKPQAVVDKVVAAWGTAKKFKSYAITVLTGDAACLQKQKDQQGGIGAFGTIPMALATLTGGKSVSICAPDFSVTLAQIGQDLRKLTQAVKLSRVPIANSVQVTFTPAQNITWTVSGDTVLFNRPVAAGTKIDVYYEF